MTLPVPQLDNRSFQSIVDEAKRKIPELLPEWTNHNVSDPGVALIELFAWMTEMTLFRLNQVPDAFFTHMLNLIGVEPFAAAPARAGVTFWLVAPTAAPVKIDKGESVATTGVSGEARVFSTVEDLVIRQPVIKAAVTAAPDGSYPDVWNDLKVINNNREVVCFPTHPTKPLPGDCFYVGFTDSLANSAIELTVKGPIQGIGIDPKRPPLVWEVSVEDVWVECHTVEGSDSTGGLNCEGRLVLLVPASHDQVALGATTAYWLRARIVPAVADQPEYKASPQITSLAAAAIGGTVIAEHSEVVGRELLGVSTNRPGQVFHTQFSPILPPRDDEYVLVEDGDKEPQRWRTVTDFIDSGKDDTDVMWSPATGEVRFGPRIRQRDGSYVDHGATPPEGARIVVNGYRYGGGRSGNVGKGTITSYRGGVPSVARVENVRPATGGVDAEEIADVKQRGPQTLRAGERAVTAADFERLVTQADAGVARVRCLPPRRVETRPDGTVVVAGGPAPGAAAAGTPLAPPFTTGPAVSTTGPPGSATGPGEQITAPVATTVAGPVNITVAVGRAAPPEVPGLVRLLLVPAVKSPPGEQQGIDDFELKPKLVKTISDVLNERRVLGTSIELRPPYYQGASVAALVTSVKGRNTARVQAAALDAVYRFLSPVGAEESDVGWPWETDLNSAEIYQLLEAVDGVDRVDDVVLFEYDLRTGERLGFGRDVLKLEPHSLFLSAKHRVVVQ